MSSDQFDQIMKVAEIGTDILVRVLEYRARTAGKSLDELLADTRATLAEAETDVETLINKGHVS